MNQPIPVQVTIAAQILQRYAIGDSIEARFKEVIKPEHLREGVYMCHNEDEQFKSAVGGVLLSYSPESEEQKHIAEEMRQIALVHALLQATVLGANVDWPEADPEFKPTGLIGLWKSRQRA